MRLIRFLLIASLVSGAALASAQATSGSELQSTAILGQPPLSGSHTATHAARSDDGACAVPDWCFGPLFTLGAIDPLGIGAHLRYGRYAGFGIDYQFLPTRIGLGLASSTWSLLTVEGRVYPFANAFFIAAGFGYKSVSAELHHMTPIGEVRMSGSVGMPALKLGIGFMGREGFVLGADVGFNFLLGDPNPEFDAPTGPGANYQTAAFALQEEFKTIAGEAANKFPVIPQVNLIRMGYLF